MIGSDALSVAVAIYREPMRVADWRDQPLPHGIDLLLRVACGEREAMAQARDRALLPQTELAEAAVFALQQLLFCNPADAYRTLGARADAPHEELRQNYRWLMKWLHPDRHDDGWETVHADRVNRAWQLLKTPERRARHDVEQGLELVTDTGQSVASDLSGEVVDNHPRAAAGLDRHRPWPAPTPSIPQQQAVSLAALFKRPRSLLVLLGVAGLAAVGVDYWLRSTAPAAGRPNWDPDTVQSSVPSLRQPARTPSAEPTATAAPMIDRAASVDQQGAAAPPALLPSESRPEAAVDALIVAPGIPRAAEPQAPSPVAAPSAIVAVESTPAVEVAAASTDSTMALARQAAPTTAAAAHQPASIQGPRNVARVERSEPAASSPASPTPDGTTGVFARTLTTPATDRLRAATMTELAPTTNSEEATVVDATMPGSTVAAEPTDPELPTLADTGRGAGQATPVSTSPPTAAKSIAPTSAEQASTQAGSDRELASSTAMALVHEFAAAYSAGDARQFNALIMAERPDQVLEQMRQRLSRASMRYLEVGDIEWREEDSAMHAIAPVRDTYVIAGERKAVTEVGRMRWELRMDDGVAKIARIEFDGR